MTTPNQLSRRSILKGSLGLAAGATAIIAVNKSSAEEFNLPKTLSGNPLDNATNEAYWNQIANLYQLSSKFINLENGFYGVLPKPVLAEYQRQINTLNENSSFYLRQNYSADADKIRAQIAALGGVSPEEIALTRGATEALQNLVSNYTKLKPGDSVLYSDLDYDSTQANIDYLKEVRGIKVVKINIPEPATYDSILDTYRNAFASNPTVKLALLTHINHKTGLAIPVPEIAALAKAKNIDVLVDAAHSWGHLDFKISDLNADFAAFNLHKWIGAPLGVGFLYIRKERLTDIHPHLVTETAGPEDIRSRVHTGTTNTANVLTVPTALNFHQQIGAANKIARLRYLRDYWVSRAKKEVRGIQILTPDDPRLYGAITSFRLNGKTSKADNQEIAKRLREHYGIFTVARGGAASGDSVRVTPAIFTRPKDLDRLVAALKEITAG